MDKTDNIRYNVIAKGLRQSQMMAMESATTCKGASGDEMLTHVLGQVAGAILAAHIVYQSVRDVHVVNGNKAFTEDDELNEESTFKMITGLCHAIVEDADTVAKAQREQTREVREKAMKQIKDMSEEEMEANFRVGPGTITIN